MPLTARFNLAFRAELTGSGDLGTPNVDLNLEHQLLFASGTGAAQADRIFADNRTLAASSTEDLDLSGAMTDPLGAALTFAKIKGVIVKAAAANPADIVIGGAASNQLAGLFSDVSDKITLPPGGCFTWIFPGTGKTVTAGTGDLLRWASGAGGNHSADFIILGTSA